MILEAIVTTRNADGSVHASALGPHVDRLQTRWLLKPFQTSCTYENLRRENQAVIHVTDDALWIAEIVCKRFAADDFRLEQGFGYISDRACRSILLGIKAWDDTPPRSTAVASEIARREHRQFFGWNRAASAIVELAIAATRIGRISDDRLAAILASAEDLVPRCGDDRDMQALAMLRESIDQRLKWKLSGGASE